MKNRLIVSLLMLFVGMSAAFSQGDARPRPFELGVFASPALNWMHSSTDECNNKGLSFSGSYGINLDINMFQATSNYYLRTGINIKHLKGKLTYNDLKTAKRENYEMIYLSEDTQKEYDSIIRPMFEKLYDRLYEDVLSCDENSIIYRHHISFMNNNNYDRSAHDYREEDKNQIVVDFISSMTDDYFIALYGELFPEDDKNITFKTYF